MINEFSEKLYKLYDMYDHVVWHIEVLEVNTRDGMSWYIRLKFEMNCCQCRNISIVAEEEERQCRNEQQLKYAFDILKRFVLICNHAK